MANVYIQGVSGGETTSPTGSEGIELDNGTTSTWIKIKNLIPTPNWFEARLTLETGVALSTTNQTAKTTLYLTPYKGNRISVYSGTYWIIKSLSADLSLSLSGYTANKNYDIWVYNNAGTLTLDSTVWTNDTTRATALTTQDGIYVKSGATGYRYVGTIRITGTTGQCEDSASKKYVWNYYNRIRRKMYVAESTVSWTYQTATWRSANNSTANRIEVVTGVAEEPINVRVLVSTNQTSAAYRAAGIGLDRTNGNDALASYFSNGAGGGSLSSTYYDTPSAGYHYFQWTEIGEAVGTCTWYSNVINTFAGIVADISC